jgi:hypothetical protein
MQGNGPSPHIIDKGFIDGKSRAGINDLISGIAIGLLT